MVVTRNARTSQHKEVEGKYIPRERENLATCNPGEHVRKGAVTGPRVLVYKAKSTLSLPI